MHTRESTENRPRAQWTRTCTHHARALRCVAHMCIRLVPSAARPRVPWPCEATRCADVHPLARGTRVHRRCSRIRAAVRRRRTTSTRPAWHRGPVDVWTPSFMALSLALLPPWQARASARRPPHQGARHSHEECVDDLAWVQTSARDICRGVDGRGARGCVSHRLTILWSARPDS